MSQRDIEIACMQTLSASTPVCYCDSVSNASPESDSTPVPPQTAENQVAPPAPISTGTLIFREDFESGDLSGFMTNESEYFGKGAVSRHAVVTSPALGRYAASLTIGSGNSTAAYFFIYKVPARQPGIYSADYYIPSAIMPGDWWNVWQWKSEDGTYNKPILNLDLVRRGSRLVSNLYYTPDGKSSNSSQKIEPMGEVTFPTDQWVNITGIYSSQPDETGYVEIYQNGVKVFELRGIQTRPGGRNIFWSVNSYADQIAPDPATIYIDNIRVYQSF